MKKLGILLGFILSCSAAWAQFTQVSGTVIDPTGLPYSNGTISPALTSSSSPFFTATHLAYTPPSGPVGLSTTGSFVMQLADAAQLSPAGTTWSFTVNCGAGCVPPAGGKGSVSFTITGVTITGASQSISAQLQAAAPALTTQSGGTLQFAGVPSGSCTSGQTAVNNTNGNFYYCNAGTFSQISAAAGATAFSSVTTGTNTVALVEGTGGSLNFTGTGIINANQANGVLWSSLGAGVLCNTVTTGVPFICAAINFPVLNQNTTGNALTSSSTTGNAATATALASVPTNCGANVAATGIAASGNAVGCFTAGTITGVTAGTGLTGGGASGSVTLNLTLPVASATTASQLNGLNIPLSKTIVGTNGSGQIVDATGATLTNNTSGNASTSTAFAASPSTCGAGIATTGITSNGTPVGCFTPMGTLNGMVAGEPAIGQSSSSAIASPAYIDAFALNVANGSTWDICTAITKSFLAFPNGQGTVDARGFTGNQGCTVASATGSATNGMIPGANCQNTTQGGGTCAGQVISRGRIQLSNTLNWFLPVVSTEAGNTGGGAGSKQNYDRIGTIVVPFGVTIEGVGNSAAGSQGGQTQILACQSAGYLGVTNCPAPSTQEIYQITSITVTQETAAPGRQYAHVVTATQSDIVAGQPFRISGAVASGNVTMVDFNNSYTACETSAYSDVVTDPSCGGGAGGQNTTGAADIYFPVNSGITSLTVTAIGSGYGGVAPTCTLPAPANAGGVQATCIATVAAGSVSGLYVVNRGTGYASGQTAGAVTLSGNATATFQTIPSSCTRGANVNCGYLYGELPLIHMIGFSNGTSSGTTLGVGVSMGDHLYGVNIDCKFVPTCVSVSMRSVQENSQLKDNWFGNSPDRVVDFHGFQTQNSDAINGNRETITSLGNRQKSVTAGAFTIANGGTATATITLTTGAQSFVPFGVYYIFGSPANLGCAKSVNMNAVTLPTYPTYIPLVATAVTGTSVTLDAAGTNCANASSTDTYTVGEICEPGTEIIYFGDVGPHGIQDNTADYSNCVNSGGFPVAYNAALRINTNSTQAPYVMGGHAEGAMYGVLAGDSQAFRGLSFVSWAGIPTPNVGSFGNNNQAGGQYQSEIGSSAIKIRSEFNTTSAQATTDYIVQNTISNNSNHLYYTVNDDNPVNAAGTDGCHVQDTVTSLYAVDATPAGEVMLSTTSCGSNLGTGAAIAPGKGGNAAIFQGQTGGTAATFTANTVTVYGNVYIQNVLSGLSHLNWNVSNPDNTGDLYDIGLYGPCAPAQVGCPIAVHIGATAGTTFAASAGLKGGTVATIPVVPLLLPGNYYIAGTCNATCTATLVTGPAQMQLVSANSATASAGGALPATITIPGQTITSASLPQTGIH